MAGAFVSDLVLVGAVALGLGALLAASEFWFQVVKWLGVAYLAFLGVMLLRSRGIARRLSSLIRLTAVPGVPDFSLNVSQKI